MASIGTDPNGCRRILFYNRTGQRQTIRLGRIDKRQAEQFKARLEALITQSSTNVADPSVNLWLAGLHDKMHARLASAGLVLPRARFTETLGAFIDAYIADRSDAKPRTIINLKQARTDLLAFFGADKLIKDVNEADADEFWRYLLRRELADNTARRICGRAKEFFGVAVRKRMIQDNPFVNLKSHVQGNAERDFFITRDMAKKVMDHCPDAQWRLIFALSRFGGLRCPSEHLALKWSDVNWETGRITVHSPKTEHHEGKASRQLPIFPELHGPLLECFEQAEPGAEHVITRYRDGNQNLRTQLERIIKRAGLIPWPKLFHNLRATRQTELAETYPIHVVCNWIGNSEAVAKKHYLQVTDAHFEQAAQKAARKAARCPSILDGIEQEPTGPEGVKNAVLPMYEGGYGAVMSGKVPPRGVEPLYAD